MEYKYTTKADSASHRYICKTLNCNKLAKSPGGEYSFCRTCRDKKNTDLNTNLNSLDKVDHELTTRQNERERLLLELERSENSIRDLEKKKKFQKMKITFEDDLVSDDHRYTDGVDGDEMKWTLETHCTIVRVRFSPENVYFGHVTLKISNDYNEEYTWHYGVPVFGQIPKDLNPIFWKFKKYDPETTTTSEFAKFVDIPDNTLLSDIMKQHLRSCAEYFNSKPKKDQWENQVWYPDDKIGRNKESATKLLKRLQEINLEREKIDVEKAAAQHEAVMKEQREKEHIELIQLERTQQAEIRRKEAVSAKRQAEALAIQKAAALEENPALEKNPDLSEEELEKRKKDFLDTYEKAENERRLRETELAQIKADKKIEEKRIAEQNEKARLDEKIEKARLAAITEAERRKKLLEAVNKEKALEELRKEKEKKDLQEFVQERREEAKKVVEKFLTKINTDIKTIKEIKINLNTEQTQDIVDSLNKECKKLKGYIDTNIDKIIEEMERYLEKEEQTEKLRSIIKFKEFSLQILEESDIWLAVLRFKDIYRKNIIPKEEHLKTFYRREEIALIDIEFLIKYYRDECLPILYKLRSSLESSNLNKEDLNRIISDFNGTIKPEIRLEELYMMKSYNIKQIYREAKDFDEPEESIIKNISILSFANPKVVPVLIGIVKQMKQQQKLVSTKSILQKAPSLGKYTDTKAKKFLKDDAEKLVDIFKQRQLHIETQLADIDPMSDKSKGLRSELYFMYTDDYTKYINSLIDEIKITLDDDDDKTYILNLLKDTLIEIEGKIRVLSNNQSAFDHLEKIEEYYNDFIKPEMEKFIKSKSKRNVDSLRAYYASYRYNLNQLVIQRFKNLNGEASKFINQRIDSLTKLVNVSQNLDLLKSLPDQTLSITDDESDFDSLESLIEYYKDIPDDSIRESLETIIRNCIPIIKLTSMKKGIYDTSKIVVQHVKDFRSKMHSEKNFSTKSVLEYYDFL